jgi:predicted nucleic acid-binding protein
MILVDTSIWIDHFRASDPQLAALLSRNDVLMHPCVAGEIALGSLKQRAQILRNLNNLPGAAVATHAEVMLFIDRHALASSGVGYVDACLLASAALTPNAALWSRDKTLRANTARCGLAPRAALT